MSDSINRYTAILVDSRKIEVVNEFLTVIKTYDDCPYIVSRTITIKPRAYVCDVEQISVDDDFETYEKSILNIIYV